MNQKQAKQQQLDACDHPAKGLRSPQELEMLIGGIKLVIGYLKKHD